MEICQRVPAGLWDNLQDLASRSDDAFLRDVARIADIPFLSLRKLFPTRGITTKLAVDGNVPWWHDQQCSMVEKQSSGVWIRCSSPMFEGPCCIQHKTKKIGESLKMYTDSYLSALPTRVPVRVDGRVLWVDDCGVLYTLENTVVEGYTYCMEHCWLIENEKK